MTTTFEPRANRYTVRMTLFNKKETALTFKTENVKTVIALAVACFRRRSIVKSVIVTDDWGKNYWYSRRDAPNARTSKAERF